jgi:hypothetical protein
LSNISTVLTTLRSSAFTLATARSCSRLDVVQAMVVTRAARMRPTRAKVKAVIFEPTDQFAATEQISCS